MRFFVAILSGYRRCLVYPTKANPNPARLFNVDDFLDKLERDSRPFAEAMCDTQVICACVLFKRTPCACRRCCSVPDELTLCLAQSLCYCRGTHELFYFFL